VRHRAAALVSTVLALATAILVLPAPASAVVAGVRVQITRLPKTFVAGADATAGTVTVVASNDGSTKGCRKVRWSMLLRVQGVSLDQVHVDRREGKSFPVKVETDGDTARLTDVKFDPGSLCPGRTVTATYVVAFDGGPGTVTFQAEAFDAATRLLQSATGSSRVVDETAADPAPNASDPAPDASESADPAPSESDAVGAAGDGSSAPPAGAADVAPNPASAAGGTPSLLGPGLIIGALLVFFGVGMLLRLRTRGAKRDRGMSPTQYYYPAP